MKKSDIWGLVISVLVAFGLGLLVSKFINVGSPTDCTNEASAVITQQNISMDISSEVIGYFGDGVEAAYLRDEYKLSYVSDRVSALSKDMSESQKITLDKVKEFEECRDLKS